MDMFYDYDWYDLDKGYAIMKFRLIVYLHYGNWIN